MIGAVVEETRRLFLFLESSTNVLSFYSNVRNLRTIQYYIYHRLKYFLPRETRFLPRFVLSRQYNAFNLLLFHTHAATRVETSMDGLALASDKLPSCFEKLEHVV
jgi:hypothetical protein